MEPILPTPNNLDSKNVSPNMQPAPVVPSVESAPNTRPEQPHEASSAASQPVATPQAPMPLPAALPITPAGQPASDSDTTDSPQIADDVDVIEKEWVDKAKKIVSATKDNPHKQEQEVSKLQADYLLKRYNKQMKLTE